MSGKNANDKKKKKSYVSLFTEEDNGNENVTSRYLEDDFVIKTFTNETARRNRRNDATFRPEQMQIYEVTQYLKTDIDRGLNRKQILSSYERNGRNNVFPEYDRSFSETLKSQIFGLFPAIYAFTGLLIFIYNQTTAYLISSCILLLLIIINSFLSVYSSRCFKNVNKKSALRTTVIRQGKIFTIDSNALVPGDIVLLQSGSVVPADIRLCEANMLYALETPITGAEESVLKDPLYLDDGSNKETFDNMVYAGTIIRSGKGTGIVCFTANNVKYRKQKKKNDLMLMPDLIRYSNDIKVKASVISSLAGFIFLFIGLLMNKDIIILLMSGVSVCASLLFETANALSSLTFGNKLKKALKSGAAVKNPNCIASLCKVDSIMCGKQSAFPVISAKVKTIFADNTDFEPTDKYSDKVKEILTYAIVCSDVKRRISKKDRDKELAYFGSNTEMAIVEACKGLDIDIESIKKSYFKIETDNSKYIDAYRTLALHDNKNIFMIKGSVEYVLSYCTKYKKNGIITDLDARTKRNLFNTAKRLTDASQFVIAIASSETNAESLNNPSITRDVVFNGFIGIYLSFDIKSAAAVLKCSNAGIETVLKTPDDYDTAVRMAKNSSILQDEKCVVSSEEIEKMGYDHYRDNAMFYKVYLHPTDKQWLQTLRLRKENGKHVLFTGEDINDLKMMNVADVSTSLSNENNDTLRQSADVILQSGGVNVIADLIAYGKSIYESIHTLCSHALSLFTTFLLLFIIPTVLNLDYPIRCDLLMPFFASMYLILMIPVCAYNKTENVLNKKTEMFSKRYKVIENIMPIAYGVINTVFLTVFYMISKNIVGEKSASTMSFLAMAVTMMLISSMRSYKKSVIKCNNLTKAIFPSAVLTVAILCALIIFVPANAMLFGFAKLTASCIAVSVLVPTGIFILYQLFISFVQIDELKGKREKKINKKKGENKMKKMKKSTFFSDFKAFISKGNVMDLAIAVVIGGAFGKIVSSLVADIIMPLLGLVTGGASLADQKITLSEKIVEGEVVANYLNWGQFVQYIIDFLIVALCIFVVIRIFTKAKEKAASLMKKEEEEEKKAEEPAKPTPEQESAEALKEILAILKKEKK